MRVLDNVLQMKWVTVREKKLTESLPLVCSFEVELLSSIRSATHIVRIDYDGKPFCNSFKWPYHCFYITSFYKNMKVPGYGFGSKDAKKR